jgi:hypothetical protein
MIQRNLAGCRNTTPSGTRLQAEPSGQLACHGCRQRGSCNLVSMQGDRCDGLRFEVCKGHCFFHQINQQFTQPHNKEVSKSMQNIQVRRDLPNQSAAGVTLLRHNQGLRWQHLPVQRAPQLLRDRQQPGQPCHFHSRAQTRTHNRLCTTRVWLTPLDTGVM